MNWGTYLAGRLFNTKIKSLKIFDGLGFRLFSTHDKWFLRPMAVRLCSLPTSASFVGRPMSGSR